MNNIFFFIAGISSGMIIFQSAINAPSIFKVFSEKEAGPFLRIIFPKLFLNVSFLSLFGLILSVFNDLIYVRVLFFASLLFMSICYLIVPATNKARDQGKDNIFKRLHFISVILTLLTLLLNFSIFFIS